MNPLQNYADTSDLVSRLVGQIRPEQLGLATPCSGWTVTDLVEHLIDNSYFFAGAAGAPVPVAPAAARADAQLNVDQYRTAATAVLTSYGADGVLDQPVETPFGTFPGSMVLSVAFADQLTHCWDLATAIEVTVDVPESLTDQAMATWEAFIQPEYRGDGQLFGDQRVPAAGASGLVRLAAFAGRNV